MENIPVAVRDRNLTNHFYSSTLSRVIVYKKTNTEHRRKDTCTRDKQNVFKNNKQNIFMYIHTCKNVLYYIFETYVEKKKNNERCTKCRKNGMLLFHSRKVWFDR